MKNVLIGLILLFAVGKLFAQEFTIKSVQITPDQLIVHYDLNDTTKNRTYTVRVYTSKDNFLSPLAEVAGDVGLEVKPGINRKVIWNAKKELGPEFDGDVELEIRGRVYIPFIRFEGFQDVPVRKRATPFLVKWNGGTKQNILNFQLYNKDNAMVYTFPNVPNQSEYELEIPTSVKPGKEYYFKIADSKNKDQVVNSSKFEIKRKIPLGLKAFTVLGISSLIYFMIPDNGEDDLETPPGLPPGSN